MASRAEDDEELLSRLSHFLRTQSGVEAILLDPRQQTVSLATLGEVDPEELEANLRSALRALEGSYSSVGQPVGEIVIRHLPAQTLLEKPSFPTAPRFWQWRAFRWPVEAQTVPTPHLEPEEWRVLAVQAVLCGLFLVAGYSSQRFGWGPEWLSRGFYLVSLVAGGWDAAKDAWAKARQRELDIHFLMLAVALGAVSIGAWNEGALLLLLFSASGAIEHFALHRTYREIRALNENAPKVARRLGEDGEEQQVPVEQLQPGDRLRVRPDELFAVDAEVLDGETACDESNLTGESTPVAKRRGDVVSSGTLNLWGVVTVCVLRPVQESALQKIIDLIRNAEHLRAPSQRFTDRFGSHYTLGILALVAGMFLVWWLGLGLPPMANTETTTSAFYRAMTLLVVASPCALVLSIPSAILAAIAWGARRGILFRGGAAIEKLAEIDCIALDKTGTLTTGELAVTAVESFPPGQEGEVLQLAFDLEQNSNHPLARAIISDGKRRGLKSRRRITQFQSLTGKGLRAEIDDQAIYLGRRELLAVGELQARLAAIPEPNFAQTEVWIMHEKLLGRILLEDQVREASREVLETFRTEGIRSIMLTGDRRGVAEAVGRQLGVAEVRAGLHPEEKVAVIGELTAAGKKVAMVGDGVNDAPSLAAAYVSIAMGGRGSDAALEQSDIVLMNDRIERLQTALEGSRAAKRVIRQNLAISVGTVVVMAGASLFGIVPLTLGVVLHEGSTLLVCLNSLRLLFFAPEERS